MSEYMGMIFGQYDAKASGFVPGGSSLHSIGTPHGPDTATFTKASNTDNPLLPVHFREGLAFMFESCYMLKVTESALSANNRQRNYLDCWENMPKLFNGIDINVTVKPPLP